MLPQEIRVSIDIIFLETPQAFQTDELKDTLCFAEICTMLRQLYSQGEYKTVERMLKLGDEKLSDHLPKSAKFILKIHKVNPPIEGLLGGVFFETGNNLALERIQ